jgi:hypothetical protein
VLRIFRPRRDEVTEGKRIHNDELRDLHSSPNLIRIIKLRMHVARMGRRETCIDY